MMKLMILAGALLTSLAFSTGNPEELGDVQWNRSLEEAIELSEQTEKPILILFQEIPGCATCRNYGNNVLRDPYVVEAIETYFVPLAIYNNKGGKDREVLKKFGEPAWNNPVVRIVKPDLEDISPRLNGVYSSEGLLSYMTNTLIKSGERAPKWLQTIADEYTSPKSRHETAVYSMYCFWTGEAMFGKVNGVYATEAGFANGKEVVKVEFDPLQISKKQLDQIANSGSCKYEEKVKGYRTDRTPKYYLTNSKYKSIEMTELQASRVNGALGEGQDPSEYLSPRQLASLKS